MFRIFLENSILVASITVLIFSSVFISDTDARIKCQTKTVNFNTNFFQLFPAFLGNDPLCACKEPCVSVAKYVKFFLYHPVYQSFIELCANGSNIGFIDRNKPTTLFVHGFTDSFNRYGNAWNNELCKIESNELQRNTIAVDWGQISRCRFANVVDRLVPQIGYSIYKTLCDNFQLDVRTVNCVGHSLGAHICGYAGIASGGQFNRCFGLDPAGMGSHGLLKTSCQNVQAFHSDSILGTKKAVGHVDFYRRMKFLSPQNFGIHFVASPLPHQLPVEVYKASLDRNNKFIGKKIMSAITCEFGARSPISQPNCVGKFYLETSKCAPFTKN